MKRSNLYLCLVGANGFMMGVNIAAGNWLGFAISATAWVISSMYHFEACREERNA